MQSVKSYLGLPDLRLPGWAELRDGSFLTRALKKTQASPEVSVIKDFEVRLHTFKHSSLTKDVLYMNR